jgi:subtilase family serine protease
MSNIRKIIKEQKSLDNVIAEPFNVTAPGTGYIPDQIRSIYNVTPVTPTNSTTPIVNVTIIVGYHYPNLKNDFNTFCSIFSTKTVILKPGTLIQIAYDSKQNPYLCDNNGTPSKTTTAGSNATQGTFQQSPASWAKEACLNSQWVYAMNPSSIITVREAYSSSINDLRAAMIDATASNADIIVMPFGTFESGNIKTAYTSFDAAIFQSLSKCYLASTGDLKSVNWPASSNCVLACGGTTLNSSSTSSSPYTTRSSETYWTSPAPSTSGGGTGVSIVYTPAPSYQTTIATKNKNNGRYIPDVSAIADPNTGVQIYYSGSKLNINGGSGNTNYTTQAQMNLYTINKNFPSTIVAGGTSASTAVIAGILSNIIQARKNSSLRSLTTSSAAFLSANYNTYSKYNLQNILYTICGTASNPSGVYSASSYAANIYNCSNTTSYNTQTGLGAINCNTLVNTIKTIFA